MTEARPLVLVRLLVLLMLSCLARGSACHTAYGEREAWSMDHGSWGSACRQRVCVAA